MMVMILIAGDDAYDRAMIMVRGRRTFSVL
jgi:hypothetical protein